ncbi:copper amine oxidase N-terminal domain-containing protein [Brevibacillus fluminis]|uniref:Copper amine oxidase N-terminal domain-containing protein n=1 Tax=Brevibacillus fluminis TaxID=511487 RepID=A0A3M8DB55_9BACL|nr:copper amine oxidase N-terminal domain-containing protein [Brevibacillus fluminis]RNB84851.1 copper amine oxidase N-terminal domain-containing protein [Brevibacillus fluminis]
MKNIPRTFLLTVLLGTAYFLPALAAPQVHVTVNGQSVSFPDESPYVDVQTNRTMVPARFVAEKLGLKVQWNGQTKQVTFTKKEKTIILTIGQNRALVNGEQITFDAQAVIENKRTMVPIRFISEAFDAQIDWIADHALVVVTTPEYLKVVQKGTWIWDATIIKTDQEKIFKFARDNDLTTIYLQIDKGVPETVYQNFVRSATEKQIKVEALAGRPQWALTNNQNQIKDFLSWVKAYNAAVESEERFAGLHFDIEPYILAEWKTNQKLVIENWMENMRFIEKETKGSGLKITLDVPFWLHLVKLPNSNYSMSAWLMEKADSVVIMDYRNTALGNDGIVANAHTLLREASTLKRQAIVAVETAPSSEGAFTTFYSLNVGAMKTELQVAKEKLSHYSSYAGFAIHDYKSWTELDAKSKTKAP